MGRRAIEAEAYYGRVAAKEMAVWAGEPKTAASKKKKASLWNRALVREEVSVFIASRDWDGAHPRHFVELYARLHSEVYGVEPLDLKTAKTCLAAAALAAKALREHFEGKPNALANFMRWVWIRQATEEKKRRAGTKDGDFRVTWRYQWAPTLVTTYRRALLTTKTERE
jgi:hypothetical protein